SIRPFAACAPSGSANAARRIFAGRRGADRRPLAPKSTHPCRQRGERVEPARARPVPFWRHGFAPPPDTRERFFVAEVPCRELASAAISAWKRTPRRFVGVVSAAGSATDPSGVAPALISGAWPAGAVATGLGWAFCCACGPSPAAQRSSQHGS